MRIKSKRDSETATRVKRVAEIEGVSIRSVYRVLNGEQINADIISTYMFLMEGENNLLLQAAKKAVPFN
jgi:hypothetical protein